MAEDRDPRKQDDIARSSEEDIVNRTDEGDDEFEDVDEMDEDVDENDLEA